jgi:ParB/RepB/Spo0J family partition protein
MNSPVPAAAVSPAKLAAAVQLLTLEQIQPDPNQPRKAFDEAALKELGDSIKADGLVQPIVVRPNGRGYYIVAGERRYRAAKAAGLKELPSIVRTDLKDADVATLQLVENVQREDLSLADQCEAVAKLVKQLNGPDGKGGQARAAERLGKSEAWVSKRATTIQLPQPVKDLLQKGKVIDLEVAHAAGQLFEVSKGAGERMVERLAGKRESWRGIPDRDEIRSEIRNVKDRQQMAADRAKDRAKKKAKLKPGEKLESPQASTDRIRKQIEAANKAMEATKGKAEKALCDLLKLPAPKQGWQHRNPCTVGTQSVEHYWGQTNYRAPTRVDELKFFVNVRDNLQVLKKITAGLGIKPKVEIELPTLAIEQLEKLIGALPGVKVEFEFQQAVEGKDLAKFIQRMTPGQKAFELVQPVDGSKPAPTTVAKAPVAPATTKKKR